MSLLISKNKNDNLQKIKMTESGVEFVGIINKKGRLEESLGSADFENMSKDRQEMFFMKITLRNSMQKDFDEYLGSVNYCLTQRGDLKFISIPTSDGKTLLAITKKDVDTDRVITNIAQVLSQCNQFLAEKITNEEKEEKSN